MADGTVWLEFPWEMWRALSPGSRRGIEMVNMGMQQTLDHMRVLVADYRVEEIVERIEREAKAGR